MLKPHFIFSPMMFNHDVAGKYMFNFSREVDMTQHVITQFDNLDKLIC